MMPALWSTALLLAVSVPGHPADTVRVPRAKVAVTEKLISIRLASLFPEEPWFLIGFARGVYLEGTGVVFSAEINLATGPSLSPFKQTITKEEIARHRVRKLERLPILRKCMQSIVAEIGPTLALSPTEEFVLAVTLLRYPWEDPAGMPSQIIMRAPRAKLTGSQLAERPDSVIKVQEY